MAKADQTDLSQLSRWTASYRRGGNDISRYKGRVSESMAAAAVLNALTGNSSAGFSDGRQPDRSHAIRLSAKLIQTNSSLSKTKKN